MMFGDKGPYMKVYEGARLAIACTLYLLIRLPMWHIFPREKLLIVEWSKCGNGELWVSKDKLIFCFLACVFHLASTNACKT